MNLLNIALLQIAPTDSLEGNLEKGTAAAPAAAPAKKPADPNAVRELFVEFKG